MNLTVFYDGFCPLCTREMRALQQADTAGLIHFEDIQAADFNTRYPNIDYEAANRAIHVLTHEGELLVGVEANIRLWLEIGKKPWLVVLRWPLIRSLAALGYAIFARHRYSISFLLTGKKRCERCVISE